MKTQLKVLWVNGKVIPRPMGVYWTISREPTDDSLLIPEKVRIIECNPDKYLVETVGDKAEYDNWYICGRLFWSTKGAVLKQIEKINRQAKAQGWHMSQVILESVWR